MDRFKQMLLTGVAASSMLFAEPSFAEEVREAPRGPVITQTYTDYAKEKAPIQLIGTEEDKEKLWDYYQKLGQTAEGRKVQTSLEETYHRTGEKVPLRFGYLEHGMGALYQGSMQGVTLNLNYRDVDEVALGHELTHDVQTKREINGHTIVYDNLKDAFIAGKLLELETKLQDTVMADEKNMTAEKGDMFVALLPLYRHFKAAGEKNFKGDTEKAVRYAKTELAKVLWEDQSMPLYQIPLNLFSRNETGKAYGVVGDWNIAYDQQSARNLVANIQSIRFQKGNNEADRLFEQFAEKMGVDLTPEYFKENMDAGWGVSVSKDEVETSLSRLALKENTEGRLTATGFVKDVKVIENTFDQNGQCLSAKVYAADGKTVIKDGNVALGLDETYYSNNGVRQKTVLCDGASTTYYPNQQVHEKRNAQGEVLEYFAPNGQVLSSEKAYQEGKEGVFYEYAQNGELRRRTTYKDGAKNGLEIQGKNWTNYKDGLKDGVEHTERSISGSVVVEEVSWKAGVRHGEAFRNGKPDAYYHNGKRYWSREEYEVTQKSLKNTLQKNSSVQEMQPNVNPALLKQAGAER